MSQRFLFEEDYGWPVRIMRAVLWSAAMGVLLVLPWVVFVVCALLSITFLEARHPAPVSKYDGFAMALLFVGILYGAAFTFLVGSVVGLLIGLVAQPHEPLSPFRNSRFRLPFRCIMGLVIVMILGVIAVVVCDFLPK